MKPPKVLAKRDEDVPWLQLKDTPGFGGADIPGVYCKFYGDPEHGPWFYLVKHDPGTLVGKHSHDGDVIHYLLEGSWKLGGQTFAPGFFQYEQVGLEYGPIISGPEGSVFLAIYDRPPSFHPAH